MSREPFDPVFAPHGRAGRADVCLASLGDRGRGGPPDLPPAYAMSVDLGAVKAAATPELVRCAVAAAANARDLVGDAQWLSAAVRNARAYALAALAVEEAGKAVSLAALAVMPEQLRAQAPVGRMLEWHQLKLVGGMMIGAMPFGGRALPAQLAAMPPSQLAAILDNAQVLAQDVDRLKQRGLYADIDRDGQIRIPAEVSEADVAAQLGRARQAVSAASLLLDPGMPAELTNPPAESVELARALVSAFAEAGYSRTPKAAADVVLNAVRKVQKQMAASGAKNQSGRAAQD
jgi:AbiV family abortive infection protein